MKHRHINFNAITNVFVYWRAQVVRVPSREDEDEQEIVGQEECHCHEESHEREKA